MRLPDGSARWGRFGAAGLLIGHRSGDGAMSYFLARRAPETHLGGTWAIPGGALDEDETPLEGAVREFGEEIGVSLPAFRVVGTYEDDNGSWSYFTLVLEVEERFDPPPVLGWEIADARWVPAADLGDLDLFGPFREALARLSLI